MSNSRMEMKVGLFVFIGLMLLAVLVLQFSKGASFFHPKYTLYLSTKNAGGLKPQANVLMAGVRVGAVSDIKLAQDGKTVNITLKIFKDFVIRRDAQFVINQSGFLGDKYVDIDPGENKGEPFQDGGHAQALEPFDLQLVARSALGFLQRIDDTAKKLDGAISDVRRLVLSEQTLTNLAVSVSTLRVASEQALDTIDRINTLFATNGAAISYSASNLVVFSEGLNHFATELNGVLATNSEVVSAAVKNVESSTVVLKSMLEDVRAGKGPAGTLLRNEQVASNLADIVNNLSITSSNLNRLGLWGILWSKRPPKTNEPAGHALETPKNPFH
jgi:phospholipid/cholesterol/gamma-HCH transport system substrate-binding protein